MTGYRDPPVDMVARYAAPMKLAKPGPTQVATPEQMAAVEHLVENGVPAKVSPVAPTESEGCIGCEYVELHPHLEPCLTCRRRIRSSKTDNWTPERKVTIGDGFIGVSPERSLSPLSRFSNFESVLLWVMRDYQALLDGKAKPQQILDAIIEVDEFKKCWGRLSLPEQEHLRSLNALLCEIAPVGK